MSTTTAPAREDIPRRLPDGSTLLRSWTYRDGRGTFVLVVGRYSGAAGKTYRPYHAVNGSWVPGYGAGPRPIINRRKLDQAPDTETAFIVEGEKCAFALATLGILATTSPGGAMQARQADWSPLERFPKVRILRDNDQPGERYAADVRDMLAGLPGSRHVETLVLADVPDHGDVCDWIAARLPEWDGFAVIPEEHRARLRAELEQAMDACAVSAPVVEVAERPEPIPLRRAIGECDAVPLDALPAMVADAVHGIAGAVQVHPALALNCALAAASVAVQAHADIVLDGRRMPPTLFLQSVVETGGRKSSADAVALAAHRHCESEWAAQYGHDKHAYECALKAHNVAVKDAERKHQSKGREAIQHALEAIGAPPEAPMEPYLLTGNVTVEGIARMLRYGRPSIGIFSDEGGQIVGGHAMQSDNMLKTLSELSSFWDGRGGVRTRAGDGVAPMFGRRCALHLQMQPDVFRVLMGQRIASTQGFMPRCLIAWPPTLRGTRKYQGTDALEQPGIVRFLNRMSDILMNPLPLTEDRVYGLQPRELPLSPSAKDLFIGFYDTVETQNGPGGPLDAIHGWASKAAEHALRIAGVLELTENLDAPAISPECMTGGIALAEFYMGEVARVAGVAAVPPEILLAEELLEWLRGRQEEIFTSKLIMQFGPSQIRDAETVSRIMGILTAHGYTQVVPGRKQWKLYR